MDLHNRSQASATLKPYKLLKDIIQQEGAISQFVFFVQLINSGASIALDILLTVSGLWLFVAL